MIQAVDGLAAAVALFAGFVIVAKQYASKHYQSSLYLAITWFGFFLEALLGSMSKLFLDSFVVSIFLRMSYIALAPAFLGVLALVDSLYRQGIELKRFLATMLFLLFNSFYLLVPPFDSSIPISYFFLVTVGLVMSVASYWIYIRIYRHVPLSLKRSATINLIGAFSVPFV